MAMEVKCETCGEKFTTEQTKLKGRTLADGIIEQFFDCPHCKTIYPVIKTNGMIRCLQKKQEKLEQRVKADGRPMNIKEHTEWVYRQRVIKAKLDELNGKVKADAK